MSVLGLAACLLDRHDPNRRDASWNGMTYIGECRHCGAAIERLSRRKWRKRSAEDIAKHDASR